MQGVVLPALIGGLMIGLAGGWLWLANGRIAGVSGILKGMWSRDPHELVWRATFILGLIIAGLTWRFLFHDDIVKLQAALPAWWWLLLAGGLVGIGTGLANGCTSGHGVCGIGRFSSRSVLATLLFMASGAFTVWLVRLLGGAR